MNIIDKLTFRCLQLQCKCNRANDSSPRSQVQSVFRQIWSVLRSETREIFNCGSEQMSLGSGVMENPRDKTLEAQNRNTAERIRQVVFDQRPYLVVCTWQHL